MIEERQASTYNGYTAIIVLLLLTHGNTGFHWDSADDAEDPDGSVRIVGACLPLAFMVAPNQSRVLRCSAGT